MLVVYWQVGLGIFKLWNFELVNGGEKYLRSCEFDKLALWNLVHFLHFFDVSCESRVLAELVGAFLVKLT